MSETTGTAMAIPVEYVVTGDTTVDFENSEPGKIPTGFSASFTGKEQLQDWRIAVDNGNKVAAQLAKNSGDHFNMLVLEKPTYENFTMSIRIKAISGNEDQGGGLVWRYIDSKNYYITRANPLENNFRVYRVVNGKRKQMESVNIEMKTGEWFTIKVVMRGSAIDCYYNGQKLLSHSDDTFAKAGLIGLWSKADAVSFFDELKILPM